MKNYKPAIRQPWWGKVLNLFRPIIALLFDGRMSTYEWVSWGIPGSFVAYGKHISVEPDPMAIQRSEMTGLETLSLKRWTTCVVIQALTEEWREGWYLGFYAEENDQIFQMVCTVPIRNFEVRALVGSGKVDFVGFDKYGNLLDLHLECKADRHSPEFKDIPLV